MLSSTQNQSNAGARKAAITALGGAMSAQTAHKAAAAAVSEQVSLQQSSRSFGPESLLAWMTGVLAAALDRGSTPAEMREVLEYRISRISAWLCFCISMLAKRGIGNAPVERLTGRPRTAPT